MRRSGKTLDLTNMTFHDLTAIERNGKDQNGSVAWLCRCVCGNTGTWSWRHLTSGNTKSCGCRKDRVAAARFRTHGKSTSPEYTTYMNMISRCEYRNRCDFKHYGGRGIAVCQRWRESFENFLSDMGPRPFPRATLERLRVNEGYGPDNCVWASQKHQTRNKRNNRALEYNGRTMTIAEWSDETGVPQRMIWDRVFSLGWPVEEALNPARRNRWSRRPKAKTP